MKILEKIYIKDIKDNVELLKKIYNNNLYLQNDIYADCYDESMRIQEEESQYMLGKDWYRYIEFKDDYSSFYLKLKDYRKFFENLDKDYLSNEGITLYDEIEKMINILDNEKELYSDEYYDYEEIIEDKCEDLLKICEDLLHEHEYVSDEDAEEYFIIMVQDYDIYDDCYINNIENDYTLYQDISYIKNYNNGGQQNEI